jgi:hypothetical protein
MEDEFYDWLRECRKANCLPDVDIEEVFISDRSAEQMFEDFCKSFCPAERVEFVRENVEKFKNELKKRCPNAL